MDIDKLLEIALRGDLLDIKDLKNVLKRAKEVLVEEDTVVRISSPVTVVGDIHGQFHDLLQVFELYGHVKDNKHVFLGDYVNRGYHSVEVFTLLLLLKLKYPQNVVLLRGNHEDRGMGEIYLRDNIIRKVGPDDTLWLLICQVFDVLPICCVVDKEYFLVHGGLSPFFSTINAIKKAMRGTLQHVAHYGRDKFPSDFAHPHLSELLWADVDESLEKWSLIPGSGYSFGSVVAKQFCFVNRISKIVRSHSLCNDGYKYYFDDKSVLTVFSAPNYMYRCGNRGAVAKIKDTETVEVETYSETEENQQTRELINRKPMYFL